jgi:hypothetical protein
VNSLFERGNPIGNFREVVIAHFLLRMEIERRVIGGDSLDEAIAQPVPKYRLVAHIAQRWRHDVFGPFETRLLSGGFIQREILNECFDGDANTALACGDRLIESLPAAQVDNVRRGAGQLGERHQVMHPFSLDGWWAALVVLTWI